MKIILIGNYILDRQESMERFAMMLAEGFAEAGFDSEVWRPTVLFGNRKKPGTSGLNKWLGYLDKWIIFPLIIKYRLKFSSLDNSNTRFHICDHSNSPYLKYLPKERTLITCHDVLAIRGALGFKDSYCKSTAFGKILQNWILNNLKKAQFIACVSKLTLDQLNELVDNEVKKRHDWRVIHNGFNASFKFINNTDEKTELLLEAGIQPGTSFILHVGSDLPRKNRGLLLEMVSLLGNQWNGVICFAGKGLDDALVARAEELKLKERVLSVTKPRHQVLEALYNSCEAFIFPSFSEGFGWPVIEAQACGAPVIASNIEPMPEIGGNAALYGDPNKPDEFARLLLKLQNREFRDEMVQNGFGNCKRFNSKNMINNYLNFLN